MKKFLSLIFIALSITVLLVACGSDDETGANETGTNPDEEQNTEGNTDEQNGDGDIEGNGVEQEEGIEVINLDTGEIDKNGEIPSEVPADFPFPDSATNFSVTLGDQSGADYIVACNFEGVAEEVYQSYKDYVVEQGYELTEEYDNMLLFASRKEGAGVPGIAVSVVAPPTESSVHGLRVSFYLD
jgi:hypothetical protein